MKEWTWIGDLNAESGQLQYRQHGLGFTVRLESFADAQLLANNIEAAYQMGRKMAFNEIGDGVKDLVSQAAGTRTIPRVLRDGSLNGLSNQGGDDPVKVWKPPAQDAKPGEVDD